MSKKNLTASEFYVYIIENVTPREGRWGLRFTNFLRGWTMEVKFQELLDKQMERRYLFNAVAGLQTRDGKINAAAATGIADEKTAEPMTPDKPYFIASITKMYTAAVVLHLYERGKLDLDDPVIKYLPQSLIQGIHVYKGRDYSADIILGQLISHTSGLADYEADKPKGGRSVLDELMAGRDQDLDLDLSLNIVRKLKPHFSPGAKGGRRAHYSNTNYQLLGAVIEEVTGRSIVENFERLIFTPLELAKTYSFNIKTADQHETPARIYLKDEPVDIPLYLTSNVPDGGIVSTVKESIRFLRGFFEGELFDRKLLFLKKARWNKVFPPLIDYGRGIMRIKMPGIIAVPFSLPAYFGHSGSTGSFAYYCPKKEFYAAGTVNQIMNPSLPVRLMMKMGRLV